VIRNGKRRRPETLSQARTFDRLNRRYLAVGLCYRCAAQAAYGHQLGFALSHQPCERCAPLVAELPTKRVNGWRSLAAERPEKSDSDVNAAAAPTQDTREGQDAPENGSDGLRAA
jgi:hypothetical protein